MIKYDAEGLRAYVRGLIGDQTQCSFAQAHDISPEHLSRMLKADRAPVPSKKTLKKLAAGDEDVYKRLLGYIVFVPDSEQDYVCIRLPKQPADGKCITPRGYQLMAARTINPKLSNSQMRAHALYGMAAEVGELQGLYQKKYQGHEFDDDHARKEVGDILWMIAEYCTAMGWDLGDVMQANIDKLKVLYPDGFDPEHSLHRKGMYEICSNPHPGAPAASPTTS